MKQIKGNALDWAEKDGYCLIHVCNNKGGFGGGKTALATQVKERFPEVYEIYLNHYMDEGSCCGDPSSVINLIAQDGYGARWKNVKYFRDDWFESALKTFVDSRKIIHNNMGEDYVPHTIVVPYLMGCDRAGGNWEEVIQIVEDVLGDYFKILVVEYDGG